MEYDLEKRWLVVHLRAGARGNTWLWFEDQSRRSRRPSRWSRAAGVTTIANIDGRAVIGPIEFRARVLSLIEHRPRNPLRPEPVPLAVFVVAHGSLSLGDAMELTRKVLRTFPLEGPFEVMAYQASQSDSPFRLPLNVAAVDTPNAFAKLGSQWFLNHSARDFGVKLSQLERGPLREEVDVLVGPSKSLDLVLEGARPDLKPRVLVRLGERSLPPAVRSMSGATIRSLSGNAPDLVNELVMKIVHDQPLHEAVASARRDLNLSEFDLTLEGNPQSVHGVRISDSLDAVLEDATKFFDTLDALPRGWEATQAKKASLGEAFRLRAAFKQESSGLVPLSELESSFREIESAISQVAQQYEQSDLEPVAAQQRRALDVRLRRKEFSPFGPSQTPVAALWVPKEISLRERTVYALEVQITAALRNSLLVGERASIDAALPPPAGAGHELTIVVYPLDFSLLSPPSKPLLLKRVGPSETIAFDLRTPSVDDKERAYAARHWKRAVALGQLGLREPGEKQSFRAAPRDLLEPQRSHVKKARLRVCAYHGNHLLQSILLTTRIEPEESLHKEPVTTARLEFSRSERLTDLELLGERAISLAVNDGPPGSHTLMFKRDSAVGSVHFTEGQLDNAVQRVRAKLEEITRRPTPISEQALATNFDNDMHQLARLGGELADSLFNSRAQLKGVLSDIAQSSEERLQVARLGTTYAFPWNLLYDFDLPSQPAPICRGVTPAGTPCGHTMGAYCVNGFWGVRHGLEELLATGSDTLPTLRRSPLLHALHVNDVPTNALQQRLQQLTFSAAPSPLVDVLWGKVPPPASLVTLSHVSEDRNQLIAGDNKTVLLTTRACTQRMRSLPNGKQVWVGDRPLIFLLGCSSVAVTSDTLVDLGTTLASAGAAAVVGAECPVLSGLAARVAREVCEQMLEKGATLGRAVQSVRRQLLVERNPLAFVFTVLGNFDLKYEAV